MRSRQVYLEAVQFEKFCFWPVLYDSGPNCTKVTLVDRLNFVVKELAWEVKSQTQIKSDALPFSCFGRANGWLHALGGCGVSTPASQLTGMRVRNSKSAPISQVACKPWLARPLLLPSEFAPTEHPTKTTSRLGDKSACRFDRLDSPDHFRSTRPNSAPQSTALQQFCCQLPHISLPRVIAFRHNSLSLTKQAKVIRSSLAFHLRPDDNLIRAHSFDRPEG